MNVTKYLLRHAEWISFESSFRAQKEANKNARYQNSAFTCDSDYSKTMSRNFPYEREA